MKYLRTLKGVLLAAVIGLAGTSLSAQEFPTDDIQFIVPYSAGGGQDRWARVIASGGFTEFGHPINVEVRPGASGTVGWRYVLDQPADGYTMFIGSLTPMISGMSEDGAPMSVDDVKIVSIVSDFNSHLIVKNDSDIADWASIKAFAAENPGALTVGGTLSQTLAAASVFSQAGLEVNLIPYPGTSAAVTDMLGGHINVAVGTPATVTSLVGEAKPVLNLGARPNPESLIKKIGEVPWVGDMGMTGVSQPRFIGVHPDTPDQIITRLDAGLSNILEDKSIARLIRSIGEQVIYSGHKDAQTTYDQLKAVIESNLPLLR